MSDFVKRKLEIYATINGGITMAEVAKRLEITPSMLFAIFGGRRKISNLCKYKMMQLTRDNDIYAITAEDFFPELSISSDKSNNNNQNLNVKNTTPSVSSDDKQIDVVEAAETQSSEPSEVAKSKVGGK